ncbi:MAG: hypothetical protein KBS67_01795 [Bacteroidales bacterium]|nr:hypothetical protein [Candidatus Cryptobacteroides equifaecalis]
MPYVCAKNVALLESAGYKYILGARIRSESPAIKDWILSVDRTDGSMSEYHKNDTQRLIVSYSDTRARKNAWNRNKGVERLRKAYAKGTLEMRPMFHFTEKRIEAHICICFVAYKVYKELERVICSISLRMSVDRVLGIAKTITTIRLRLPNGETFSQTLFTTPQQEALRPLLDALKIDPNEQGDA